MTREVCAARDAVRARDCAAAAAGFAFVEAAALDANDNPPGGVGVAVGAVPPLALVSHHAEQLLNDAGEGTLGLYNNHFVLHVFHTVILGGIVWFLIV